MNFFDAEKEAKRMISELSPTELLSTELEAINKKLREARDDALRERTKYNEAFLCLKKCLSEKEALRQQNLKQLAYKWIACRDMLPEKDGRYLVWYKTDVGAEYASYISWAEGWNCYRMADGEINRDTEFHDVVAWAEITPYKETEDDDD